MNAERYYFGCWNSAGHVLFEPLGRRSGRGTLHAQYYVNAHGDKHHLDGTLAPRRVEISGMIFCAGLLTADALRDAGGIYGDNELPQGCFVRHSLSNGFTAIQWFDRCQGDTRSGCNSTILLRGDHPSETLLKVLADDFPTVLENIKRGGPLVSQKQRQEPFELREVFLGKPA